MSAKSVQLLDGGMGQELIRRSAREPTVLWSTGVMLNEPDIVRDLHVDFIRSGARTITVNAYSATPQRLARDGEAQRFSELQAVACRLAVKARQLANISGVRIAGCLPPLVGSYHAEVEPAFQQALDSYRRIVAEQADHVDLMLCETVASTTQARAAALAGLESDKPVWVALTVNDDASATLRSGEPLQAALDALDELGVDAILLNCSRPEAISAAWTILQGCSVPFGAYPNGFTSIDALQPGGTVSDLEARTDLGPETFARLALSWISDGASIIGGCCEIGPAHIAKLAERLVQAGFTIE